jgi:hypothetical protein
VRALYGGFPKPADLEQAGLTPEECTTPNPDGIFYDVAEKKWFCELWEENWPALDFYRTYLIHQWRHGFSGPTGLDYNVLLHELDRRGLTRDEYDDLFDRIRVIEEAVLDLHDPKPA